MQTIENDKTEELSGILAHRIEDTAEFHTWLSENTGIKIRTNYADNDNPITYIGDTEWGIELAKGGFVVIDGKDFCIMEEDCVREAVAEYYEKYLKGNPGSVMEIEIYE